MPARRLRTATMMSMMFCMAVASAGKLSVSLGQEDTMMLPCVCGR